MACGLALVLPSYSLTVAPATPEERVQNALAICHGTGLGSESFRSATDGRIYTQTWLRVNEALKGRFPATITVVHCGGHVAGEGESSSDAPGLITGKERLFMLGQSADGTLFVDDGGSGAPKLARMGTIRPTSVTVTDPNAVALLSAAKSRYPDAAGPDLTGQAANALVPRAVSRLLEPGGISRRFTAVIGARQSSIWWTTIFCRPG